MQIEMVKNAGGVFVPAFDHDLPRLTKFKNGEMYTADIKLTRNPAFHRKMFAFFNFCFAHWAAERAGYEFTDEYTQKKEFRNNLTILAGFFDVVTTIKGETKVRAKSLAYGNMEPDEFERCYNAMVNAAIKHLFGRTTDQNIIQQLQSFFLGGSIALRVRDIPVGMKFCIIRSGHKFTMIGADEKKYRFHVIAHSWTGKKGFSMPERKQVINGQSYVKPVVRSPLWLKEAPPR